MTASRTFPAAGTTATVAVTAPSALDEAADILAAELAAMDRTCSRFRADSEISRLHLAAGRMVTVSPLLVQALAVALRAARRSDGLVDPTVGAAVEAMDNADPPVPAPGWHRVLLDPASASVVLPRGVRLDLGATAKALAADRAAYLIAQRTGAGALVRLGGDVSTAGTAPPDGWQVALDDGPDAAVILRAGGLSSSRMTRPHRHGGEPVRHIVDPRTGHPANSPWRAVSVTARSCVDANTAATAAIILGEHAPLWLADRGVPARLVANDGAVCLVGGWPADLVAAP
ncbi:FAD:protein FMN transferase [Actinokineospora sp. HUAS TT18]|uniref:FAD:protein FMN transferase n=1 Tax=Actinokineospora sp. HUAS TT18 TaxID=3447451 RepID=UPI003F525813